VDLLAVLEAIGREIASTLYEGSLWILLGFIVAGALHVLIDPLRLARLLGERSVSACVRAALLGAPIPLCSCGVLPTAAALRKKGASREATLSFLITTPEVGVDSIAMTAAYFGPLMAVIRPLVAVVTGITAGALSLRTPEGPEDRTTGGAADAHEGAGHARGDPSHRHHASVAPAFDSPERPLAKLRRAARFAFVDIFDDLAFWLLLAVALTALVGALLPADFFARVVPSGVASMVLMVVVGAPLYVCASASTPLAAAFVAKGASAGAALVFLLVGPATNAATMATVRRTLGPRLVPIYLSSIVGVAIAAGLFVDVVFPGLGDAVAAAEAPAGDVLAPAKQVAMGLFAALLLASLWRTGIRAHLRELGENARASLQWLARLRLSDLVASAPVRVVAALWLLAVMVEGFTSVPAGAQALVRRFGALTGMPREPGLVFAVPIAERVTVIRTAAVRERPINFALKSGSLAREPDPDVPLYVTADENLIDVRAAVHFRVREPAAFALGSEDTEGLLAAVTRAELASAMAAHPIDLLYTRVRADAQARLLERVRAEAERLDLGVDVLAVRLIDVHAPFMVHDAFRDVASAREDRETTIHQASEYAAGVVAIARGEAEKRVADARGWALGRLSRARADAERFLALTAVHRRAPALTEARLYLETAERVLPGARKVVRATVSGPRGYELWLRAGDPGLVRPGPEPAGPPTLPAAAPARRISDLMSRGGDL
jgi:HflK protein